MSKMFIARFEALVLECAKLQERLQEKEIQFQEEIGHSNRLSDTCDKLREEIRNLDDRLNDQASALSSAKSDVRYYRDAYDREVAASTKMREELRKYRTLYPTPEESEWATIADELVKNDKLEPPSKPDQYNPNGGKFPVYPNKLGRIKEFRERTHSGLKEAKDAIEEASLRRWKKEHGQTLGELIKEKLGDKFKHDGECGCSECYEERMSAGKGA